MKIAFVEFAGFRGFRDQTRLEFPDGFVVLVGRNGSGKSTVLDAFDFLLTGTINKYAVTAAKGGGLTDHIWWVGEGSVARHYVSIGFRDDAGEFVVTRSRERGLEMHEQELADRLCLVESPSVDWAKILMQTTLLRDETIAALSLDLPEQARFAAVRSAVAGLEGKNHSKRTAAILSAATANKATMERRLDEIQAELSRRLGALTEAKSAAERQPDVAEATAIIDRLVPHLAENTSDRLEGLRRHIVNYKRITAAIAELTSRLEVALSANDELSSPEAAIEVANAQAALESALIERDEVARLVTKAEVAEAAERESDEFASHLVALLEHGEAIGLQNGHCPLCNAVQTHGAFRDAIAAARNKLSQRGDRVTVAATALMHAKQRLRSSEEKLALAQQRLEALETRRTESSRQIAELEAAFQKYAPASRRLGNEDAGQILLERQEIAAQLEYALFALETSTAHSHVTAHQERVSHIRESINAQMTRIDAADRTLEAARQIDQAAREIPNQILAEQFDTVMPLLKELYRRLRPHTEWREIDADFGGRVRASLNLSVGEHRNPQFLFSSGQRRAAGLAFLMSITLSRPWSRLRSVLLDDPVQHIDDYRALNLVEVLSAVRRTGRQVVVSVEDQALADVLCRRLRSTPQELGRRFELTIDNTGSATVRESKDILPLPREVLQEAIA